MFTEEQIHQAAQRVQSGADFPKFAKEIKDLGVQRSDVFVMNGLATYYGAEEHTVQSGPAYEELLIESEADVSALQEALKVHQNGASDYQTFCRQAAASGVEKWIVDLNEMKVVYYDTEGHEMLTENIPA